MVKTYTKSHGINEIAKLIWHLSPLNGNDVIEMDIYVKHLPLVINLPSLSAVIRTVCRPEKAVCSRLDVKHLKINNVWFLETGVFLNSTSSCHLFPLNGNDVINTGMNVNFLPNDIVYI